MNEEKIQQNYLEMQMLGQQLKQMQQQSLEVESQMIELESIKQALKELPKTEIGSELLVPLSQGIYIKGSLKENKELIVNVGAGTAVVKSIDEASGMVNSQMAQMREFQLKLASDLQNASLRMQQIESDLSGA